MTIKLSLAAVLGILCLLGMPASAGDRWRAAQADGTVPPCDHICEWVRDLKQPEYPNASCCGEADRFEADNFERDGDHYVAIITDGHGAIPDGTRIVVPNEKIKWDAGNPTGRGQIFLGGENQAMGGGPSSKYVFCYVPPGGV
jgi:hypothetical protein